MTTIAEAGVITRNTARAALKRKLTGVDAEVLVLVCANVGIRSDRLAELLATHESAVRRSTGKLRKRQLISATAEDGGKPRVGVRSLFLATHEGRMLAGEVVRDVYEGRWVDQ
jgi:predicted ArsR family transcriptional regulator